MMRHVEYLRYLLPVALVFLLSDTAPAQTYVGDQACAGCHANHIVTGEPDFFDGYMRSGHPWKVFRTGGLDPATEIPADELWPFTMIPPLPFIGGFQLFWTDVEYTIGNYYWKTRFIRPDGFIYTGDATDSTQYNIATDEFVPYHAGEVDKPFDCGKCHTTGYEPTGNQNGLPGLIGTWAQDGVRCEACHGPASAHVASPVGNPPTGGKDCSECHFRDAEFRMPWKGGFMRHHQQGEDLSHSPHQLMSCNTCHNPHRSVVYEDGGTITHCTDCHAGDASNNNYVVAGMETVDCMDCHMPFMGKSATNPNPFKGDIRGHLFQIMTEPIAAADNVYDVGGSLFWNQDAVTGQAEVTLDYACLGCHTEMTLQEASAFAQTVHQPAGNLPPIVDAGGPYTGEIGQAVMFDASNTVDPEGDPLIYLWDFGDGTPPPFPSQDPTASHTYAEIGEYAAQLAVTDGTNDPVLVDVLVTITDAPVVEGDVWTLISPYSFDQLTLRLEPFAGILMVEVIQPSGAGSIAIGMELQGVIFWMDVTGAIYFGNIDRPAGSMSGVAFGGPGGGGIWFAEQL